MIKLDSLNTQGEYSAGKLAGVLGHKKKYPKKIPDNLQKTVQLPFSWEGKCYSQKIPENAKTILLLAPRQFTRGVPL